jgi:UDP-N-acetylglucosamine 2-epimerase (non-hydrolysing)
MQPWLIPIRVVFSLREAYQLMAQAVNPYGDGHAAERIVEALISSQ